MGFLAGEATQGELQGDPVTWFQPFHCTWHVPSRFCTSHGLSAANVHKWCIMSSDKCECGTVQTMPHIANVCQLTIISDGGLQRLHCADNDCLE